MILLLMWHICSIYQMYFSDLRMGEMGAYVLSSREEEGAEEGCAKLQLLTYSSYP